MVWHIALTLLCLLCIIGSIIFKERFSFLFPEMIVVAFYVMIFSLLLPLMIQKFNSVQDLYIIILLGFIFLVFIIFVINVIKRLKSKKERDIRVKEVKEVKETKVNVEHTSETEQLSLQKVRLKQIISEQRNSLAQQTTSPISKASFSVTKADVKEIETIAEKVQTKTVQNKISFPSALDTQNGKDQRKAEMPEVYFEAGVPEQRIKEAEKPVQEKNDLNQIKEQYNKAQVPVNIAPIEIPHEKEEDTNQNAQQMLKVEIVQIPELAVEEKEIEHPPFEITEKQADTKTEQEVYPSGGAQKEKDPDTLAVDQEDNDYEKDYKSALSFKECGNYHGALQLLKKLLENQLLPERRKRLEIEILKLLAVSGEYQEATNEVYTFLSNGYSLNEEENKEIIDILYLLQENA